MPATDRKEEYTVFNIVWHGIELEIRHQTGRYAGFDHIEVISEEKRPLPITETGYRSQFILPERIAEYGEPLDYVLAWLDFEADTNAWKRKEAAGRQLSLF